LWLLAALSGFLLIPALPPFNHGILVWVALVPLFWAIPRCSNAKQAVNLGAVTGIVFYTYSFYWMTVPQLFGPFVAFAFFCLFSLWVAFFAGLLWHLWRRLILHQGGWGRELALAAMGGIFWAGLEYFRSEVWFLKNSWMALGYSQVSHPALLQSCSLIGNYGLSAIIVAVNLAVSLFLRRRWRAGLVMALLLLALGGWGLIRLNTLDTHNGRSLQVALLQEEDSSKAILGSSQLPQVVNADLVVWPEDQFNVMYKKPEISLRILSNLLRGIKAVSAVGCWVYSDPVDAKQKPHMENFCWVMSPLGNLEGRYDKLHPIPYVEPTLKANPDPKPIDTEAGRLGVQICYDLDFEDGTRKMAWQGAQILVVPTYDPMLWGVRQHYLHSGMSPIRAVESGLWLVRATSSGESQIIDPLGRVQASSAPGHAGVLAGNAYLRQPGTVYTFIGWLTGPFCLGVTLLYLLGLAWGRIRKRSSPPLRRQDAK
jgi:apolipoprotein N-acyltransferase